MLDEEFSHEEVPVSIALFDLDNTLLDGDSDYLWGCFLAESSMGRTSVPRISDTPFLTTYSELDELVRKMQPANPTP